MIAILHNIRSVYNVGSIFRTADAAGVKKIYLCGYTPAPKDRFGRVNQALSKVALNAEKYVFWETVASTVRLIEKLRNDGNKYKIFAVEQAKKSIPYYSVRRKDLKGCEPVFIMGNEIKGLPHSVLVRADSIIEIPMYGKKESLNVSVAFGIAAFHLAHIIHE